MTRWLLLTTTLVAVACGGGDVPAPEATRLPAGVVELDAAQLGELALTVDTVRLVDVAIPLDVAAMVSTPDPATAHLGSIVEGQVKRIPVLPGDRVRAGQALVIIHSHELSAARRDLAAAEAQVAASRAAVERSTRLLEVGAVSLEEVQQRRVTLASAEAEAKRADDLVEHLHPEGDDVTIVAPTDGTVLAVRVNLGEAVTVGMPLVEVGDVRSFWVTGWVPERAVPFVRSGTTARVVLAAFPGDTFAARVVRTGGALDASRRALDVRVALLAPPAGVVPGMYATLLLDGGARALRATLPAEAVQRTAEGNGVFVREMPGRFRFRPVTSAIALPEGGVAVEGLEAGLEVVTRGAYRLRAAAHLGSGVPEHD